jgi:hypothetical protein
MLHKIKTSAGDMPWQNKVGLDEDAISLLAEDFNSLEKLKRDLPVGAIRFALDGEGDDILTRLASTAGASESLGLTRTIGGLSHHDNSLRAKFFESLRCTDATFFVRLGKLYEAASRSPWSATFAQAMRHSSAQSPTDLGEPGLRWLEVLLVEATQLTLNTYPRSCSKCPALNAPLVETMLCSEGYPSLLLARMAFEPKLERFWGPTFEPVFLSLDGLDKCAERHRDTILETLNHADFQKRVYALSMMRKCKVPIQFFIEKLVGLALGSSKQVREEAEALLATAKATAKPLIEAAILDGETSVRAAAVRLYARWEGDKARPFMDKLIPLEKNKKVMEALREAIAVPPAKSNSTGQDSPVNDIAKASTETLEDGETEKAWQECFNQINAGIPRVLARNSQGYYDRDLKIVDAGTINKAFSALSESEVLPVLNNLFYSAWHKEISEPFKVFWQRPELQPIHLVRFLIQVGALKPRKAGDRPILFFGNWAEILIPAYRQTHPEVGLRELGAAFSASGLDPASIGEGLLSRYHGGGAVCGIPSAQIWPYWVEHLKLLEDALLPGSTGLETSQFMERFERRFLRANAFNFIAHFPKPPEQLVAVLWRAALGPKSERPQAQRCLKNADNKTECLTVALSSSVAETRSAAAEWLGRIGDRTAVEALVPALKKEKNEAAKGTLLVALELLGATIDQFLNRADLLKEAERSTSKEMPDALKWFPLDQLPSVYWQDTAKRVSPVILRFWLIQGFKLKNPEPGSLLRRYCASLKSTEREALGKFILEAWIAEDTAPIPRAEAEQRAMSGAQSMVHFAQYMASHAQKNSQGQLATAPVLTVDQYYAQLLPAALKQPKGSAIASKGILSLAGACVGAIAPPIVSQYLKEWYGQRAAQCRALLQMLAWVEHRTATQLLLAVASRFRTKSIQEEATKQVEALAERKGWTLSELADRTIPSAGMDEEGILTIDYGPRQFRARLGEDLKFSLTDSDGKLLKSLPEARKEEDETKVQEAKKQFSAFRKELKSVLTMQRDRLYEAMCTQRTWEFEDWRLYMHEHPIMKHYCQRLVWLLVRSEGPVRLFRPLGDGSLTDENDDPLEPKNNDQLRIAHGCHITATHSEAWRKHLNDYNIVSLFDQFGRTSFVLTETRHGETEISDFRGHLVETFKLRGRATKLGYNRGQTEDGGWFYLYKKRFQMLGIEAVIEFTGNGLPEANRTVALTELRFSRHDEGHPEGSKTKMHLSEVPSVLLSECWNDIRAIAGEGPGFDPEWEKKVQL